MEVMGEGFDDMLPMFLILCSFELLRAFDETKEEGAATCSSLESPRSPLRPVRPCRA